MANAISMAALRSMPFQKSGVNCSRTCRLQPSRTVWKLDDHLLDNHVAFRFRQLDRPALDLREACAIEPVPSPVIIAWRSPAARNKIPIRFVGSTANLLSGIVQRIAFTRVLERHESAFSIFGFQTD